MTFKFYTIYYQYLALKITMPFPIVKQRSIKRLSAVSEALCTDKFENYRWIVKQSLHVWRLVAGGQEEGCLMAASGAGLRKMDRWSAADTPLWDSGWGAISCNCSAHVRKPHIDTVSFNVLHCFQSNFGTITTKFCYKSWLYQTSMDTGSFHGWNIAFLSFICTLQTLGLSPHNLYELVPKKACTCSTIHFVPTGNQ